MDNLTHSLFGLTLARTPLNRAGRGATVALLLASNAPDIDIVTTAGGALKYLEWHRGPTHGLLGIIGLGLATAGVVTAGTKLIDARTGRADAPPKFWPLALLSMVGILFHILMDLPTSYGTRPLSPFAWTWFTTDWLPIVDVYLLAILAGGLWLDLRAPRRGVIVALTLTVAFYALRATTHQIAIERAPAVFGAMIPARCDGATEPFLVSAWPRGADPHAPNAPASPCLKEIAAIPDMLSPFRWRLLAQLSDSYESREIDLLPGSTDATAPLVSTRYPNQWPEPVMTAATSHVGRVFLGFARFPAARFIHETDGRTTVRWSDLRFVMAPSRNSQPGSGFATGAGSGFFSATVSVGADGKILSEQLGIPTTHQ
ncbi:MAG: metal-dependent hydrolase [Acidobacteriaceae bacterium]|nr:metal-dependent hydrolase [Acidobacteriaceae bacterium]